MKKFFNKNIWSISDFIITKELVKGRASVIYIAIHKATGVELVLKKCVLENEHERTLVQREIQIHESMNHPRIVPFYGYFFDTPDIVYLMLEYARGGDLFDMMTTFKMAEDEFKEVAVRPIVDALVYIHSNGIVHCDIKMENIFLTVQKGGAKLGDFGFSMDEKSLKVNRLGTLEYMAPEILQCNRESRKIAQLQNKNLYGDKVDSWAMGVLVFEGLVGEVPWKRESENFSEYLQKILDNPFDASVYVQNGKMSNAAARFIEGCLQINPSQRFSSLEMKLNPWLLSRKEITIRGQSLRNGRVFFDNDTELSTLRSSRSSSMGSEEVLKLRSIHSARSKVHEYRDDIKMEFHKTRNLKPIEEPDEKPNDKVTFKCCIFKSSPKRKDPACVYSPKRKDTAYIYDISHNNVLRLGCSFFYSRNINGIT